MDLLGPTTSVGTRTDYSVGPWDYLACAARQSMAWSTRTTEEKYSVRKLYMSRTVWTTPRRTRLVPVGVTVGHCAMPASTRACRSWQVAGPGGADPPAGAPSAVCHWPPERRTLPAVPSTSLHGLVAPARSYLPQPTFPHAYKPVPAVPRADAFLPEPPPSAIAAAR
jgi:hypothetical protein